MRSFVSLLAAFGFPLLANAYYNVTYNSNDPALAYSPVGAWRDWPAAGCLSWPIGQWTAVPGSITLRFSGVAVHAYGLYDDESLPITEVQINDEAPERLSTVAASLSTRCDPIYSRTGLDYGNHTIVFRLIDDRLNDVKDLSFQGFIVTVPDPGDNVEGSPSRNRKSNTGAIIAGVAVGAVVIILAIVAFFFWRRKQNRSNKPGPVPATPHGYGGLENPPHSAHTPGAVDAPDHSVPPPVPFVLPPAGQQQYGSSAPPWLGASQQPQQPHHYPDPSYNGPNAQSMNYSPGPSFTPPINAPYPVSSPSSQGYDHSHPGTQPSPGPSMQQYQPTHLSYQPPPSEYSSSGYASTAAYGAQAEKAHLIAEYAGPNVSTYTSSPTAPTYATYTPPPAGPTTAYSPPPPPEQATSTNTNVPYRKGQVNPNATPVIRNDNAGPSGDSAPPPEYGA